MGVASVAEEGEASALLEEVEADVDVLCLVARDGSDVPLAALALSYDIVVAGTCCEDTCVVPRGGHRGDVACALLFAEVACGAVGQHLQSALEADVQGHLVGPGASAHGQRAGAAVVLGLCVVHGAWREVHGPYGIAHEGQPDAVLGLAAAALLQAAHAFVADEVGQTLLQSGGFVRAVVVDEELVVGALAGHTFVEVHHPLVAVVHEVDLQSLHAHLGIEGDEVHVLLYGEPREPEDDADVLACAVLHELLDVYLVACGEGVLHAFVPAFVQQDVFHAEAGSAVDDVLIGIVVDAGLEVDAPDGPMVPPVPVHFARLDPRCVVELALAAQHDFHLVLGDVLVLTDDGEAPWQGALCVGQGDAVALLRDGPAAVAARLPCLGRAWEDGGEAVAVGRLEEHVGIVAHVALREEHLRSLRALEQDGQVGHLVVGLVLGGGDVRVGVLVGGLEALRLGDVCHEALRQVQLQSLVHDLHQALAFGGGISAGTCFGRRNVDGEAVGYAVVVSAYIERDAALEGERQLVGLVGHLGILQGNHGTNHLVHLRALRAAQLRTLVKLRSSHLQAQGAVLQNLFAAAEGAQREAVAHRDFHLDVPVGRRQGLYFLCTHSACCHQGNCQ